MITVATCHFLCVLASELTNVQALLSSKYAKYFKDKRAWTFVNSEAKTQRK
jgi:hypothetical protein